MLWSLVARCPAVFAAFLLPVIGQAVNQPGAIRVGLAKVDITPTTPVTLAGYASRKGLSQGVHDPLSARVIAFDNGTDRLVLVSTDIIGFYQGTSESVREAILEACNLKPSELFLTAIHTHAAPSPARTETDGHPNNLAYTQDLTLKLIQVTRAALADTVPVELGTSAGSAPIGVNRREVVFDPTGNPKVRLGRNPTGVTDPEVQVLKVSSKDGVPRAVCFSYSTHSTALGYDNYQISGDVHGLAEQFVENYLGPDVIAPAFAGASANIDPWYRILPEFHTAKGWMPEPVLMGTWLGEEVVRVARLTSTAPWTGRIRTALVNLELPGKPRGELRTSSDEPLAPFTVTVGRVGAVAFVGLSGEVFCEIGKAIKTASPFQPTFVITHCNGTDGYLPTGDAYLEGGYEVTSSPFASTAAAQAVREVLRALNGLE